MDPVEALEALARMRDRGLVTEPEYEAKRTQILSRLGATAAMQPMPRAAATRQADSAQFRALSAGGLAVTAGGILFAAGSALPWISVTAPFVGTITRSGLEGGDGIITLILGVVITVVGLASLSGSKSAGSKAAMFLLCLSALGLAAWELINVRVSIGGLDPDVAAYATVGIGPWMMVAGGLIAVLGIPLVRR
jgi:hypothetical protein